jgi:hypothetical protein
MKKFAVVIVLGLGLSVHIPCQAGDTTETKAANPAPSAPASTRSNSSSAGSPTANSATASTEANKTVSVETTTGKSKHHKKVAHKHKNNPDDFVGDGVPLSKLGTHKDVDGGFDFDNSKKFH